MFFGGLARRGCGFSSEDDYAGGAFIEGGFGFGGGLVFLVIEAGEVIIEREDIGLFCAEGATDASDFTH